MATTEECVSVCSQARPAQASYTTTAMKAVPPPEDASAGGCPSIELAREISMESHGAGRLSRVALSGEWGTAVPFVELAVENGQNHRRLMLVWQLNICVKVRKKRRSSLLSCEGLCGRCTA